jgi:predicted RNase H-like nuclease (RuvC/YqgF family)
MNKGQLMNTMNFLIENAAIITSLLGGGLGWFLGGRQKQDIEIKKSNSDAVQSMQQVYDTFLEDFKQRVADLMIEVADVKKHNKELQTQFNDIYIQYSKEAEKSLNWERLHTELAKKYNALELNYESLKSAHDKLKSAFETYKKTK